MARTAKNARKTATKTAARRAGRPTNAERDSRIHSQQNQLIDVAIAAASAAVKSALGIEGTVSTIGSIPQIGQSQSAGIATDSTTQAPARKRQAPGRRIDPNSNMSKARAFYAANQTMERATMVTTLAEKLNISKQVANTYVSNIDREAGFKLTRRRGAGGRSRGASRKQGAQSQAASA